MLRLYNQCVAYRPIDNLSLGLRAAAVIVTAVYPAPWNIPCNTFVKGAEVPIFQGIFQNNEISPGYLYSKRIARITWQG